MWGGDGCIRVRLDYLEGLTALCVLLINVELLLTSLNSLNALARGIIWDGPYLIFITIVRLMISSKALSWLYFAPH